MAIFAQPLLTLLFVVRACVTAPPRPSRSLTGESFIATPRCELVCDAQWKSEFQINFGKLYHTDYFEVPLDSTLMQSKENFKTFCASTAQKYACLKRECNTHRYPWTPERHICITHRKDFEKDIDCLSKTDKFVQKECTDVCNKLGIRVAQAEAAQLILAGVSIEGRSEFDEQNKLCHFIACHQMCHEHVISNVCSETETASRSAVKSYYDAYLHREYNVLHKEGHEELFSSFCRRVTPGQDENKITPNMTLHNNRNLNRMRAAIKQVHSKLPPNA